ncbi:unnamed protein product [Lactuca virosa]|uniref:ADP-ribosyl cyclase/cyclic ADP-ribose hydrolase n=1 Tax=Lactuca virosa TaxID=75947 RepID=A0AAU9N826_9ASTR|nr:unnamed protein product [Lactuca virosa]
MASFPSYPSSSSSAPTRRWIYDVFLSFRGEDTRNNFVDHLYAALDQRGIHVFKDDKALHKGKLISRELLEAIEESRPRSDRTDGVTGVLSCRSIPCSYRGHKRDFHTAFQQHDDKFRGEIDKVNKWRKALAAAAGLSGWHVSETGVNLPSSPRLLKRS